MAARGRGRPAEIFSATQGAQIVKKIRFILILALLNLGLGPAKADPHLQPNSERQQSMRVVVVRSARSDCEPQCPEWISAEGKIVAGTLTQFKRALAALGERKLPILVSSSGGSVQEALAIGRLIRARQMDVAVSKTRFSVCQSQEPACPRDPSGMALGAPALEPAGCASACSFILAAGTRRFVGPYSAVGVHQMSKVQTRMRVLRRFRVTTRVIEGVRTEVDRKLIAQKVLSTTVTRANASKSEYEQAGRYFAEMGIDDSLMQIMTATPATSIHWLNAAEVMSTHMATDILPAEFLIARDQALSSRIAKSDTATSDASVQAGSFVHIRGAGAAGATLRIGFTRPKGDPTVQWSVSLARDGAPISTQSSTAYLRMPDGQIIAAENRDASNPTAPLTSSMSINLFCGLRENSKVMMVIEPWLSDQVRMLNFSIDLAAPHGMARLFGEACPDKN